MKKASIAFGLAIVMGCLMGSAQAASTSVTIPLAASVQSVLELNVEIRQYKDGVVTNYAATAMNFGTLKSDKAAGPLRGDNYFDVYIHPNSSGRPFRLTQSATALTNGTQTLPVGACIVTPWSVNKNGQAYPAGAVVGTQGTFVANKKVLYTSDTAGSYAPVAMTYSIPNSPTNGATQFVPYDQAGGSYNSTVTFEIALTA